eukprot:11477880-Prorocentrum_lima.AAC.1
MEVWSKAWNVFQKSSRSALGLPAASRFAYRRRSCRAPEARLPPSSTAKTWRKGAAMFSGYR